MRLDFEQFALAGKKKYLNNGKPVNKRVSCGRIRDVAEFETLSITYVFLHMSFYGVQKLRYG